MEKLGRGVAEQASWVSANVLAKWLFLLLSVCVILACGQHDDRSPSNGLGGAAGVTTTPQGEVTTAPAPAGNSGAANSDTGAPAASQTSSTPARIEEAKRAFLAAHPPRSLPVTTKVAAPLPDSAAPVALANTVQEPGTTCTIANLVSNYPDATYDATGQYVVKGQTLLWTASTDCASAQYRFVLMYPDGTWTEAQDWSTSTTLSWDTTNLPLGLYQLQVWVRSGNVGSYQTYGSRGIMVNDAPQCGDVTVSPGSGDAHYAVKGEVIHFVAASPCTGQIRYKFILMGPGDSTYTTVQDWSSKTTFDFDTTGHTSGYWGLMVLVSNVTFYDPYIETYIWTSFIINDWAACTSASVVSDDADSSAPAGQVVHWTATSSCAGPAQYRFVFHNQNGPWVELQGWSASNTFTWDTTGVPGGYWDIQVWVRDASFYDYEQAYGWHSFIVDAPLGIPSDTPAVQDFSSLTGTSAGTLPIGWKIDKQAYPRIVGSYATATASTELRAGAALPANSANGIYNFGAGVADTQASNYWLNSTDRAPGWLAAGSDLTSGGTKSGNLYVALRAPSDRDLPGLSVGYQIKKFNTGTSGYRVQLYSSSDGVSWTSAGNGFSSQFTPDASNGGYDPAPGNTITVSPTRLSANIPRQSVYYLAWNYTTSSATSNDGSNAQALAVDNVNIQAAPCFSNCSSKHCGDSLVDNCGNACSPLCASGDTCKINADCQAGLACGPQTASAPNTCQQVTTGGQCSGASATVSSGNVPLGATVTLTATATCSLPNAEYRFVYAPNQDPSQQSVIREWGPALATWDTTGVASGSYTILVYVRASGNAGFDAIAYSSLLIGVTCDSSTLTVTPQSPYPAQAGINPAPVGTQVTLTGAASCNAPGVQAEFQYFYMPPASTAVYTRLGCPSGQSTCPDVWTRGPIPFDTTNLPSGTYGFFAYARAQGNSTAQESSAYAPGGFLLGSVCTSTTLSTSVQSPQQAGTRIRLSATATCLGNAPAEYHYFYRNYATEYSWHDVGDGFTTLPVVWNTTTLTPGTYQIQVVARRVGNTSSSEAYAVQNFDITQSTATPVTLTIPQSTSLSQLALFGNTVTIDSAVTVSSLGTRQAAAVAGGAGGVSIGAQSVVGGVTSGGAISIATGANIQGPILASGAINNASSLVDSNSLTQNVGPLVMTQQVLSVQWPTAAADPLTVSDAQSITPRSSGAVTVASGGTLQLLSGDYYFDSLSVQSGGKLSASNVSGGVRIFLRGPLAFSGQLEQASNDANVIFISSGTTVNLASALRATVWAPNAQLTFAPGATFTGSFIGDVVHVQDGAVINREPTFQQPMVAFDVGQPGEADKCTPGGDFFKVYNLVGGKVTTLENARDWICVFTSISGIMNNMSGVYQSGNSWIGATADGAWGTATCLHKSCFSSNSLKFSGPFSASASADYSPPQSFTYFTIPEKCTGKTDRVMAGPRDEAAVLSQFYPNHPRGQGEKARVEQITGSASYIDAYDEQCNPGTVIGGAYSFRAGPLGQSPLFDGPNASHALIETANTFFLDSGTDDSGSKTQNLAPVKDAICYLSSLSGQYLGGGEAAVIDTVSDDSGDPVWRLQVYHHHGGAPGGVQAEATCYALNQDVCSSSSLDGLSDPSTCNPLTRQRFDWMQWAAPRLMGVDSDRACFLTALSGDFRGASERIDITAYNGMWQLNGISAQQGVYGEAQCVAAKSVSNEITWNNSMPPADLGVAAGRACFLTGFSGRLGGGGESVHIYQDSGRWYLSGETQQVYITASARCINVESVDEEKVWEQGQAPIQLTDEDSSPRKMCFLTGVRGRFNGNGEYARVRVQAGPSGKLLQWLDGTSGQVDVESRAVCATLLTDPQAGPPEPVPAPDTPDCSLSSVNSPQDCDGFAFASGFSGAAYLSSDTDGMIATAYSCRPLSCFQSGAADSVAAAAAAQTVNSPGCAPYGVSLSTGDAVSHLLTFTSVNTFPGGIDYGQTLPATHGDGEWAKVTQAPDASSLSLLEVQHCSDETLGATAGSLLLNTSGSPVKFMAADGTVSTYNASVHDFVADSEQGINSTIMTPVATSTCVFTRAQGNFIRGGEFVSIDQQHIDDTDHWVLHAQHLSGTGVSATVRCFPNNQSAQ